MKLKNLFLALAALSGLFISGNARATCSNYATYADGQVLTASSLNSLQTNYTNCVNAVLDGDTFTGNMLWHSGSDILMYSDTGSTLKASIEGSSGAAILGQTMPGESWNCGISNSGTTFTIAGFDGTALSATNPCVIAVKSNTAGRTALAYFTANVTFTHGATSDTDGNDWGITNSVNWANAMPFFIGVIYDGTTPYFTISRGPMKKSGSAATDLCQKGDTDCDAQTDIMILATGLTLANFINLPITQVGWFEMTFATTGTAWTASTSSTDGTGFNDDYEIVKWTMPSGQNGAASGKYFSNNGGTAPVFTTNDPTYYVKKDGWVFFQFFFSGDGGTDGATSGSLRLPAPYQITDQTNVKVRGTVLTIWSAGANVQNTMSYFNTPPSYNIHISRNSSATAATDLNNTDFTNGSREVAGSIFYPAFIQ